MHIDLEAIKTAENLERYCDDHLQRRGDRAYNCPLCGSGTRGRGITAFSLDGKGHFRCFSCKEGGDLLDLIGKVEGIENPEDRTRRAAEFCGIGAEVTERDAQPEFEPAITPPHRNADKLIVVVGTQPEAARVRALGYRADVCEDGNYILFVNGHKASGLALVGMLNDDALRDLEDSCRHYSVTCVPVDPTITSSAFDGSDATLSHALSNAARRFEEFVEDGKEARLRAVGVHPSWDITMDVLCGNFVREAVKTGIGSIDESIGGIPRGGVTVIGALSSTGKTSLCTQIADNLARDGKPVLFATLEQDRHELAIMSLSRIIGSRGYDYTRKQPPTFEDRNHAYRPATRQWLQEGPKSWTPALHEAVIKAGAEYDQFASSNMHYMETEEPPTVAQIRLAAETVRDVHEGVSPTVIVDYLQLIAHDERRDERLATNDAMSALRRCARDLATPVVVISALNRQSLTQGVTLAALRESGGIEYAADLVLGLQPATLTERVRNARGDLKVSEVNSVIDEFRDRDVKELDLRVLKNRGGSVPLETPRLHFDGRCGLFFSGH